MYMLEEFAFMLLASVVLTVFAALAGLAGWGMYRLLSRGSRIMRRSRPVAVAAFFLSHWMVRARSAFRRAPESASSGLPAPLPLSAAGHPSSRHWTLPHFHFGRKLQDHSVAKIELALWFLWAMVTMGLLIVVAAWVFRGRLAR